MTAIKVENLTKIYKLYDHPQDRVKESLHPFRKSYHRDFYALQDVSFEVQKGETVGIIGKNGSGKSTLLKIITGLLTPSSGNVEVNGKVSSLLELGAGFNPEFTGIENIYLNGTIMGYTREEMDKRLDDILAFADIGDFVYQQVKTYSSGMFVRLAFAVAINVDPDILIIDEALSVGDINFQFKCYSKFNSFKELGKTILFVTHAVDLIKTYCDKAIFINDGKLVNSGSPKIIVNEYLRYMRKMESKEIGKNEQANNVIQTDNSIDTLQVIEQSLWYNKNEYRYGTGEVVFTKIGLFNLHNETVKEFEAGEYIIIEIEAQSNIDIEKIYFGYGIRNAQGIDLFVYNGTQLYEDFYIENIKKNQSFKIRIKQKIILNPNDYGLAISLIRYEDDKQIQMDIRYDCCLFKTNSIGKMSAGIIFDDSIEVSLVD